MSIRTRSLARAALLCLITVLFLTAAVQAQDVVFLTPVANGDSYAEASESDPLTMRARQTVVDDPAVQAALTNYKKVQLQRKVALKRRLEDKGLSPEKISVVMASYPIRPAYIVLSSGSGGNACSVGDLRVHTRGADGRVSEKVLKNTPAVVLSMNGVTMTSGDRANAARSISHELGHGVMAMAYGDPGRLPESRFLGKPHWHGMTSDRGLALIEGWAEANGPMFSSDPRFTGPLVDRRYRLGEDGTLKSFKEMASTEGFVASFLFSMMNDPSIADGYAKALETFSFSNPAGIDEFVRDFGRLYPADSRRLFEIYTEVSAGANVSSEASEMYGKLMTGQIDQAKYDRWLAGVREAGWREFSASLAMAKPSSAAPVISRGSSAGPEQDPSLKLHFGDSYEGRVTKGGPAPRTEALVEPYEHYIDLVRQGKRNTPEAAEALRMAMDASRREAMMESADKGDRAESGTASKGGQPRIGKSVPRVGGE